MSAQAGGPRCTETGRKRAFAGKDRFEKKRQILWRKTHL